MYSACIRPLILHILWQIHLCSVWESPWETFLLAHGFSEDPSVARTCTRPSVNVYCSDCVGRDMGLSNFPQSAKMYRPSKLRSISIGAVGTGTDAVDTQVSVRYDKRIGPYSSPKEAEESSENTIGIPQQRPILYLYSLSDDILIRFIAYEISKLGFQWYQLAYFFTVYVWLYSLCLVVNCLKVSLRLILLSL